MRMSSANRVVVVVLQIGAKNLTVHFLSPPKNKKTCLAKNKEPVPFSHLELYILESATSEYQHVKYVQCLISKIAQKMYLVCHVLSTALSNGS